MKNKIAQRKVLSKNRHMKQSEVTKEQWEGVKPLLPPEKMRKHGRPRKDDRMMLNGMLWSAWRSVRWRDLPEAHGLWQSAYARFAKRTHPDFR